MNTLTTILATLTALEFFYIFYIETIATQSDATSRVFKMSKKELARPTTINLFRNQGVYNGLIGVLLIYGAFFAAAKTEICAVILAYIISVALYGAITVDKKIILTQGGLAILTLASLAIF